MSATASVSASSIATAAALEPLRKNLFQNCPGGLCEWIQHYSELFLVVLIAEGLVFLATLVPPLFSWSKRKPDGKKRVLFALLACVTFYFWLAFLALNSVYCFGFLAHEGPCKHFNRTGLQTNSTNDAAAGISVGTADFAGLSSSGTAAAAVLVNDDYPAAAAAATAAANSDAATDLFAGAAAANESCGGSNSSISPHEADLRNVTLINCLIIVVLVIVLVANAREALNAKALHHIETLCKKDEVQKFLSAMVMKPPEVGHYVSCFHQAKASSSSSTSSSSAADAKTNANSSSSSSSSRKVVTFSAIENFEFQSWRDFSDLRLVDPSSTYPIIEIEVVLNFFPGDHFTAERYKTFVMQLTKKHSSKDAKINIDDYFHIEDHREWTFFIGNPNFLSPWWDRGFPRFLVSCVLLFGWPFRLGFDGQIAKHQVEIKKAVFCENSSQDEGVSLQSATPGSSSNETGGGGGGTGGAAAAAAATIGQQQQSNGVAEAVANGTKQYQQQQQQPASPEESLKMVSTSTSTSPLLHPQTLDFGFRQQQQLQQSNAHHYHYSQQQQLQLLQQRSIPLTSPRTHLRETTKDIVTAVTHQDINGMSTINTIALNKDIDVQMSALSGYETYV